MQKILLITLSLSFSPNLLCWWESTANTSFYWHIGAKSCQWHNFRRCAVELFSATLYWNVSSWAYRNGDIKILVIKKNKLHIRQCRQNHQAFTQILFLSCSHRSDIVVGKIIPFVLKRKLFEDNELNIVNIVSGLSAWDFNLCIK